MGLFDTVSIRCPKCGVANQVQSKAGECKLRFYRSHAVPADIAMALDGTEVGCIECSTRFKLYAPRLTVQICAVEIIDEQEG